MNKDSLLKRHYSSLERPRRTRKGFRPRNTLLSNSGGSSPPNELIDLNESHHNSPPNTVISSPKTKVNQESSRQTRSTPSKIVIPSSPKHKKPQLVPDAFNILININHCRLDEEIDYYTFIEEVTHKENGFTGNNLMLNISKDGNFLFFTKRSTIIEQGVINMREQLKHLFINERPPWTYLFIELAHDKGYFCVKFTDSNGLQSCLKKWKHNYIMNDDLGLHQVLKKYHLLGDDNDAEHSQFSPKSKFDKISPLLMYGSPKRRSYRLSSRLSDGISYKESDTVDELQTEQIYEAPADFSPLLQHKFTDGKVFTITQSDLKTLYNNDWINDNIMDFFINFEIENAVKKLLFTPDQIYAFNSFFFPKLVSKNGYQKSPDKEEISNIDANDLDKDSKESPIDYYGNIKRWISRIDLFSYPYIIIPINENSHWYCCLIKRMPQMLEFARKRKNHLQKKLESLGLGDKASDPHFLMETLEEAISQKDDYINSFEAEKKESKIIIYVFDSLSQKHNNIHAPIKSFIIGACLDKFDIPLVRSDLSFRSAKVPKQRNFNDCGIHVLYNVRKWLSDCDECFRVWNSPRSNDYRTFFVAQERNPLRREFIDILLSLHRKVYGEGSKKNTELDSSFKKNDISDDDEVELLEVKDLSLPQNTQDEPKSDNLHSNNINHETKSKGLDPLSSMIKAKGSPVKSKVLENESSKSPIRSEQIKSNKPVSKAHKYSFVDTDKPDKQRNKTINNKILKEVFDNDGTSTIFRNFLNFVAADEDQPITKDEIADLKVLKHRVDKVHTNDEETLNREFATLSNDFQYFKQKRSTQLSRPKDEELVIKHTEPRQKVRKELDAEIQDLSIDYSSNSEEFDFSIGSTTAQSPRITKKPQRNESLDPWVKANKENRQDMSVPVSRLTSNSFNHLIKDSASDTPSKGGSIQQVQQSAALSPPRKISGPKKRRID